MRLIDADALNKKLCGTTIFIKDGEAFQRMINDAPTIDAAQRGWRSMSMMSELVKELRSAAKCYEQLSCDICTQRLLLEAADTIEALSLKLAANNLGKGEPSEQGQCCDGCDIFTMAEELAMASIDACADEIVRQFKDSIIECDDCKHHHTSEMYEYCDVIAVKGRRQRVMKYCSLGERRYL